MPKYSLPGGATRREKAPPYHLAVRHGFRRTAKRFGLGAQQHGQWNWLLSLRNEADAYVFACEAYNHMLEHALKMGSREEPEDDHLGAIGWAQTVLSTIEARFGKPWTELAEGSSATSALRAVASVKKKGRR